MTKQQLAAVIRHTILSKECARELAGELDWMITDAEFEKIWRSRPAPKALIQ
jgi:hypothetical protein